MKYIFICIIDDIMYRELIGPNFQLDDENLGIFCSKFGHKNTWLVLVSDAYQYAWVCLCRVVGTVVDRVWLLDCRISDAPANDTRAKPQTKST